MLRVLIVDDDMPSRIGLKRMIDWQENGYFLIGEASNGEQALELAREQNPDIVLTDMKMPKMNGVELIQNLQAFDLPPVSICLSSYDEYHLVRDAMKYGAKEYLLKGLLTPQTLLTALKEAEKYIVQTGKRHIALQKLKTTVLKDFVSEFYTDAKQMRSRFRAVGIHYESERMFCLIIRADDFRTSDDALFSETHTLQFSVINIVEELTAESFQSNCVEGKIGEYYCLGCIRREMDALSAEDLLRDVSARIQDILRLYLDLSCIIGIGSDTGGLPALQNATKRAAQALENRFCFQADTILFWDSALPLEGQDSIQSSEIHDFQEQLAAALLAFDENVLQTAFDAMRKRISLCKQKERIIVSALSLLSALQDPRIRCAVSNESIVSSRRDILAINSWGDLDGWFSFLEQLMLSYIQNEKHNGLLSIVRRAREMIEKRYAEDLSVQDAAQELNLTPGYLGTLMKKYTGKGFVESLTEVRIAVACDLLKDPSVKIYDVAKLVGYNDQFYFSRSFKRTVGVSPAEYRKNGGGL
ncbi:response regulator [uncultured Oscillibacter sp.]|uniref:response regulator transcription factor n=1 Tax=uncultured Oscillibacter sp. TaxID=876091 RepID=UPI00272B8F2A|nr:response regulator [uncultured Oscillibacter sp.]